MKPRKLTKSDETIIWLVGIPALIWFFVGVLGGIPVVLAIIFGSLSFQEFLDPVRLVWTVLSITGLTSPVAFFLLIIYGVSEIKKNIYCYVFVLIAVMIGVCVLAALSAISIFTHWQFPGIEWKIPLLLMDVCLIVVPFGFALKFLVSLLLPRKRSVQE